MARPSLVFTDLDGTLLDHLDYSHAAAAEALDYLRRNDIPLILCSSKTAAEIAPLREELGFQHCPAIVENGAGTLAAGSTSLSPAPRHAELLGTLAEMSPAVRRNFSGFSEWSLETLMQRTGLDECAARRAARRDYTEPGLLVGDEQGCRQFLDALEKAGLSAQQGGRFLTLGFGAGKAQRMHEILRAYPGRRSIALGDAPNDIELLQQADTGIIVPNPAHAGIAVLPGEQEGRILRASRPGPAGWNDALLAAID